MDTFRFPYWSIFVLYLYIFTKLNSNNDTFDYNLVYIVDSHSIAGPTTLWKHEYWEDSAVSVQDADQSNQFEEVMWRIVVYFA